jgi:prefoldin subunit 5
LQDGEDHLDDLLNGGSSVLANVGGKDGGSAKLEGGGEVTVDVGDGTTIETMLVIASEFLERVFVLGGNNREIGSVTESRSHQLHICASK